MNKSKGRKTFCEALCSGAAPTSPLGKQIDLAGYWRERGRRNRVLGKEIVKNRLLLWILVSFAAVFLWQGFKQIGQDTHNLGVALSNLVPLRKSPLLGCPRVRYHSKRRQRPIFWHPAPDPTPFRGDRAGFSGCIKGGLRRYPTRHELLVGERDDRLSRRRVEPYRSRRIHHDNVCVEERERFQHQCSCFRTTCS